MSHESGQERKVSAVASLIFCTTNNRTSHDRRGSFPFAHTHIFISFVFAQNLFARLHFRQARSACVSVRLLLTVCACLQLPYCTVNSKWILLSVCDILPTFVFYSHISLVVSVFVFIFYEYAICSWVIHVSFGCRFFHCWFPSFLRPSCWRSCILRSCETFGTFYRLVHTIALLVFPVKPHIAYTFSLFLFPLVLCRICNMPSLFKQAVHSPFPMLTYAYGDARRIFIQLWISFSYLCFFWNRKHSFS